MTIKILRLPSVLDLTGNSRSGLYAKIRKQLFVPPVSLGPRAVGWPDNEVHEINAATIAGNSEAEIRRLVARLVAERQLRMGPTE